MRSDDLGPTREVYSEHVERAGHSAAQARSYSAPSKEDEVPRVSDRPRREPVVWRAEGAFE